MIQKQRTMAVYYQQVVFNVGNISCEYAFIRFFWLDLTRKAN